MLQFAMLVAEDNCRQHFGPLNSYCQARGIAAVGIAVILFIGLPAFILGTNVGFRKGFAILLAALSLLDDAAYKSLRGLAQDLQSRLEEVAGAAGVALQVQRAETIIGLYFTDRPVTNYAEAKASDAGLYRRFFHALLRRGVYIAPSPFEALFVSLAHAWDELERTTDAAAAALAEAIGEG